MIFVKTTGKQGAKITKTTSASTIYKYTMDLSSYINIFFKYIA